MEQNNATMDASPTEYLSAVYNIDDPRSESMKISMAEHFCEFEHEYREDPHTDAEVVYEDDQVVVVADHTGHELTEWVSDFNMTEADRDAFYTWNHEVARELTDHDWSVVDPVVFDKLGKATRHAEEKDPLHGRDYGGEVAFFNDVRDYGFIESEDVAGGVFFDLTEIDSIEQGVNVAFDIEQYEKGPMARSVIILDDE